MATAFFIAMTLSALTAAVAVPCALMLMIKSNRERQSYAGLRRVGSAQRFQAIFGSDAPVAAGDMMREAIADILPGPASRTPATPSPARAGFASA